MGRMFHGPYPPPSRDRPCGIETREFVTRIPCLFFFNHSQGERFAEHIAREMGFVYSDETWNGISITYCINWWYWCIFSFFFGITVVFSTDCVACFLWNIQPITDKGVQNLEIVSQNFQFSTRRTRILMGSINSTILLPGTIVNPMGNILVCGQSFRNNLKILCHHIC